MMKRSSRPPRREAASTPSGTAISTVSTTVTAATESVGSRRWPIRSVTRIR
ncbi:hypothetical protein D9M69_534990 [compost metagenome]